MPDVLSKFLRYVKIDTPSDENNAEATPSTPCQLDLAKVLYKELCAMGIKASMTDNDYVYAKIPANAPAKAAVGFIAHTDVVSEPKGFGVKPKIVKYTGGDIVVGNGAEIRVADCPELKIIQAWTLSLPTGRQFSARMTRRAWLKSWPWPSML